MQPVSSTCRVTLDGERCPGNVHLKSDSLCNAHYLQMRRGTPFKKPRSPRNGVPYKSKTCSRAGCDSVMLARGLCGNHYYNARRGDPDFVVYSRQRPSGSSLVRDAEGNKECPKCDRWLPESEFGLDSGTPDKKQYNCKTCVRKRPASPSNRKREGLPQKRTLDNYGKDDKWFLRTLAKQGKGCAVCASKTPTKRGWAIDHDHGCCPGSGSCGECVRGILCANCNLALGLVKDSQDTLLRMIDYLKEDFCD